VIAGVAARERAGFHHEEGNASTANKTNGLLMGQILSDGGLRGMKKAMRFPARKTERPERGHKAGALPRQVRRTGKVLYRPNVVERGGRPVSSARRHDACPTTPTTPELPSVCYRRQLMPPIAVADYDAVDDGLFFQSPLREDAATPRPLAVVETRLLQPENGQHGIKLTIAPTVHCGIR